MSAIKKYVYWLPHPIFYYTYKLFFKKRFEENQKRRTRTSSENENSLSGFDKYKCIFIHIPKAGGVSLAYDLFGNLGGGHLPIYSYYSVFSPKEFNEYYKFSVVRNPWDRLVSAYVFLKEGGFNEHDRSWFKKNLSMFNSFEDLVLRWINKNNVYSFQHFIPQFEYLMLNGRFMVDKIYKIEEMPSAINDLNKKFGISLAGSRINKTKKRKANYREYYTEESMKIVAEVYSKDITYFGYTF